MDGKVYDLEELFKRAADVSNCSEYHLDREWEEKKLYDGIRRFTEALAQTKGWAVKKGFLQNLKRRFFKEGWTMSLTPPGELEKMFVGLGMADSEEESRQIVSYLDHRGLTFPSGNEIDFKKVHDVRGNESYKISFSKFDYVCFVGGVWSPRNSRLGPRFEGSEAS